MKTLLDACCGSKMFHFDKNNENVLFCDNRHETHMLCDGRVLNIKPDMIVDFKNMPHENDHFDGVIFDPPHLDKAGPQSWQAKKYGKLDRKTWREELSKGFEECWRVLKPGGFLFFKWNETQIKLRDVLACFSQTPTFGHTTTHNLKTHWVIFYKPRVDIEKEVRK